MMKAFFAMMALVALTPSLALEDGAASLQPLMRRKKGSSSQAAISFDPDSLDSMMEDTSQAPTFTLPNTPIEGVTRQVASIEESQWPVEFCINIDITMPPAMA